MEMSFSQKKNLELELQNVDEMEIQENLKEQEKDLFDDVLAEYDEINFYPPVNEKDLLLPGTHQLTQLDQSLVDSQNEIEQERLEEEKKIQSTGEGKKPPNENKIFDVLFDNFQDEDLNHVFREDTRKLEKNNNVPKNLLRGIVYAYNTKGNKFFKSSQKIMRQVNSFILNEKKMYKEHKNWNNNLTAMKKFFCENQESKFGKERSFLMRKMAHSLIRSEIIPNIQQNKQIENMLKSYMFTLKVQMLRARSEQLMSRTETH